MSERLYLLRCPQGYWWRANRCGYTTSVALAGTYSAAEAKRIERGGRGDRAVPLDTMVTEIRTAREEAVLVLAAADKLLGLLGEAVSA